MDCYWLVFRSTCLHRNLPTPRADVAPEKAGWKLAAGGISAMNVRWFFSSGNLPPQNGISIPLNVYNYIELLGVLHFFAMAWTGYLIYKATCWCWKVGIASRFLDLLEILYVECASRMIDTPKIAGSLEYRNTRILQNTKHNQICKVVGALVAKSNLGPSTCFNMANQLQDQANTCRDCLRLEIFSLLKRWD